MSFDPTHLENNPGRKVAVNPTADRYSERSKILDTTKKIITGDRNIAYGEPHEDFARTAAMVTAMWQHKLAEGQRIEAHEVAEFIAVVKLSRLQWSPGKEDHWIDLAGYAACGYEAFVKTHPEEGDARPTADR